MRIIAFGDIHMDPGAVESIPSIHSADLVIITGDITNYGNANAAEKMISRLLSINRNLLGVAGNLDKPDVARYLEENELSLHGSGRIFGKLGLMGLGGSNYTPFKTPYEFSEQELAAFLAAGLSRIQGAGDFILVSHTPPFRTQTDRLANGSHVGSTAVRTFIEQQQPALCLTGHIHESAGEDVIGRTRVLNPGMLKHGGYIEVILEKDTIKAALCSQP